MESSVALIITRYFIDILLITYKDIKLSLNIKLLYIKCHIP